MRTGTAAWRGIVRRLVPLVVGGLVAAGSASARDFTVDTASDTDDPVPGDGRCGAPCSLRAAIQEANALAQADPASEHTIRIPAGRYPIAIRWGGGGARSFFVAANVTISGAGAPDTMCPAGSCSGVPLASATVLDGGPTGVRVLEVANPTFEITASTARNRVTFRRLAIVNGNARHPAGTEALGGQPYAGGGLKVGRLSDVSLDDVALQGNTAEAGGAIENEGRLILDRVAVLRNRVRDWHPPGSSSLTVPGDLCGGGVRSSGRLHLQRSVVAENTAAWTGGAICGRVSDGRGWRPAEDCPEDGPCARNHEIGDVVINDSVVRDNTAGRVGGGIHAETTFGSERVTIVQTVIRNNAVLNGQGGGLDLGGPGRMDLEGLTVEGNVAAKLDEGLRSDVLPGAGGGIFSQAGWTRVFDSTIRGNTAGFAGGGITSRNGRDRMGSEVSGLVALSGSVVSDNSAPAGGGVYNTGGVSLRNSTLSRNQAARADGGAILSYGTLSLAWTTIAHNHAAAGGPGLSTTQGSLSMRASLIVNDCLIRGTGVSTGGYNFIDAAGCTDGLTPGAGDLFVFDWDPGLLALADNGGPTQTMAVVLGSPALDRVPAAHCDVDVDQRGFVRPRSRGCEAGAYERQPLVFRLEPCCGDAVSRVIEGAFATSSSANALPSLVAPSGEAEALTLAQALAARGDALAKATMALDLPSSKDVWDRLGDLQRAIEGMDAATSALEKLVRGPALARARKLDAELRALRRQLEDLIRSAGDAAQEDASVNDVFPAPPK
jgi:CSLREA domain-containing protein